MDNDIDIAARIDCLRKFIEHQYKFPQEDSNAYNILSSLIHGRLEPTTDAEGLAILSKEQIDDGISFINEFILDFDYSTVLKQLSSQKLLCRYGSEQLPYIKMLILRDYTEQNKEARERLRDKNDVLRKYVDETYHIENDYIYSLDVRRFNIVPENYIVDADAFVRDELSRNNVSSAD